MLTVKRQFAICSIRLPPCKAPIGDVGDPTLDEHGENDAEGRLSALVWPVDRLKLRYTPPPPPSALNPANQPAYAARLREALRDALLSAGQDEPGGIQVVRVQTAVHELIRLIAFAAYQSPDMKVPSRCRKWTDDFSRELRWAIQMFQRADAEGETREVMYVDDAAMDWPK